MYWFSWQAPRQVRRLLRQSRHLPIMVRPSAASVQCSVQRTALWVFRSMHCLLRRTFRITRLISPTDVLCAKSRSRLTRLPMRSDIQRLAERLFKKINIKTAHECKLQPCAVCFSFAKQIYFCYMLTTTIAAFGVSTVSFPITSMEAPSADLACTPTSFMVYCFPPIFSA